MEIKLFSDLIDTLGKVANGLKALVNLPRAEREKYRQTMNETYRLIDTTLNMVIIRLGDILLKDDDQKFLYEVEMLENYGSWMQAEREFRLCQSLRAAFRETETLRGKLTGKISTHDWDALLGQMRKILSAENEVANYIGDGFRELSYSTRAGLRDPQMISDVRKKVKAFRDALINERKQLIQQESELYPTV